MSELIEVVDENDVVIGKDTIKNIYDLGKWHRTVQVYLVSDGKVLLHKRSKHVKVFAGYWDATAGGGVHSGETYEEAAARELKEEAGISVTKDQLIFINKLKLAIFDKENNIQDNIFKSIFVVKYSGNLKDIKPMEPQIEYYKAFSFEEIVSSKDAMMKQYVEYIGLENFKKMFSFAV